MLNKSRSFLLVTALLTAPLATAMAQPNNPTGNLGSNRSATAAPGTADNGAASTMTTGDSGARTTSTNTYGGAATSRNVPGATGHTVVPGNNSSQASAASSTAQERTGSTAGGGSR